MEYELTYKGKDEFIVKQCLKNREPLPERIFNKPILNQGLLFYLQAFFTLETERSNGTGISPIPFSAILQYCEYAEITDRAFKEDFIYIMRELDNFVMDFHNKKLKEAQNVA